jgi:hypothetical protein
MQRGRLLLDPHLDRRGGAWPQLERQRGGSEINRDAVPAIVHLEPDPTQLRRKGRVQAQLLVAGLQAGVAARAFTLGVARSRQKLRHASCPIARTSGAVRR